MFLLFGAFCSVCSFSFRFYPRLKTSGIKNLATVRAEYLSDNLRNIYVRYSNNNTLSTCKLSARYTPPHPSPDLGFHNEHVNRTFCNFIIYILLAWIQYLQYIEDFSYWCLVGLLRDLKITSLCKSGLGVSLATSDTHKSPQKEKNNIQGNTIKDL